MRQNEQNTFSFCRGDAKDRRTAPRVQPAEDAREATVWLSRDHKIDVVICDVAAGGVGVLSPARHGLELQASVTIEYQGVRLTGTVVQITDANEGQVRVGIQYARSSAIGYSSTTTDTSKKRAAIKVGRADGDELFLEQSDGCLEHRILVKQAQLKEIIEFLAASSDAWHVVSGHPEDIYLRVIDADKSFSITQGSNRLIGFGDIRQVLEPIDATC